MMKKLFQKMQEQFSNIVSVLALAASSVALWQTHEASRPQISVEQGDPIRIVSANVSASDPELICAFPMILTNHGGRPGALLQITHPVTEPAMLRVGGEKEFQDDEGLTIAYMILDSFPNSREELHQRISSRQLSALNFPQTLSIGLDSGESKVMTLVVVIRDKLGMDLQRSTVTMALRLRFSDGTSYRLAQAFLPRTVDGEG